MNRNSPQERVTYSVTPMQEGMLFHCLAAPGSGIDVSQVIGTLHERLEVAPFARAWQRLADRHQALRMRFLLDEQGKARQVPREQGTFDISQFDLSGLSREEQ